MLRHGKLQGSASRGAMCVIATAQACRPVAKKAARCDALESAGCRCHPHCARTSACVLLEPSRLCCSSLAASHHPPPPVLLPQNLLCMKLAAEMGVLVASPWVTWVKVRRAGAAPMSEPACALLASLCAAAVLHLPQLGLWLGL